MEVIGYLAIGATLGFTAGISPGPLLALVVAESARHGWRGGVPLAFAPLLTDGPIVAAAVLLLSRLPAQVPQALGVVGGLFVAHLGVQTLRDRPTLPTARPGGAAVGRQALKGLVVNLLNPHPYLFWGLVGAPLLVTAGAAGLAAPLGFLLGFYTTIVGSKAAIALLVDQGVLRLGSRLYRALLLASGAALVLLGLALVAESTQRLLSG